MSNQILHGISDIVNPDSIKPGIDIKELEKSMVNGGLIQKQREPQDRFKDELNDIAKKLGMDLPFGKSEPKPKQNIQSHNDAASERSNDSRRSRSSTSSRSSRRSGGSNHSHEDVRTREVSKPPTTARWERGWLDGGEVAQEPDSPRSEIAYSGGELQERTREQERRSHITSVMNEMGGTGGFDFENEKKEDMKCVMLEQIDSLISSLQEDDIPVDRIPKVDSRSSYEDVEKVLKVLKHKNDRNRYCNFAEEFLMFGAYSLEDLFDGKRVWLGKFSPDLTDWHQQVNVKLRRMRHDTSTLVGNIMHDYNIGPGLRILLELIPNMVIYSKSRKKQHSSESLYSDEDIAMASNRIRDIK